MITSRRIALKSNLTMDVLTQMRKFYNSYIFRNCDPSNLKRISKKKQKIGGDSENYHFAPISHTKLYFFIQALLGISVKDLDF
jgi:hypothetical protein